MYPVLHALIICMEAGLQGVGLVGVGGGGGAAGLSDKGLEAGHNWPFQIVCRLEVRRPQGVLEARTAKNVLELPGNGYYHPPLLAVRCKILLRLCHDHPPKCSPK